MTIFKKDPLWMMVWALNKALLDEDKLIQLSLKGGLEAVIDFIISTPEYKSLTEKVD